VDEASFLAVDLLVKLLAGKRPQRLEYILPVHLVVRGSTRRIGPPVAPGCDPSAQVGMMQDTAS
jgi:hypothetical protein